MKATFLSLALFSLCAQAQAGGACYIDGFSTAHVLDCGGLGDPAQVTIFDSSGAVISRQTVTYVGQGSGSECSEVASISTYANAANCVAN